MAGCLDGVRVLSAGTVAEMLEPRPMTTAKGATVVRGYGVDIDSSHSSAPRGERFGKGTTFGHTGYTGTSLWVDPANDAFVVLLTNRVHPDDKASISPLRRKVATLVAEALLDERKPE